MTMNIPNLLTIFRVLAAPALALIFLTVPHPLADMLALALFVIASLTDWLDGYLARKWNQMSKFGAMLDPIADKSMVAVACVVLAALWGMNAWIVLPLAIILFREVLVSGLREYLGDKANALKVTKLAKWKTTVQMVAIAVLLSHGIFEHALIERTVGMDPVMSQQVLSGEIPDEVGLLFYANGEAFVWHVGRALLWIAALLTFITGADYFRKCLPFLREK